MNSGNTSIRALGQRSIASSFLSCSSKSSSDSKEDIQSEASKKGSGSSLANFLDRKLHTTSVLPRTVEGKSRPFQSPLGPIEASSTIDGFSEGKKVGELAKPNFVIGKVFFEQFKQTGEEKGDCEGSCSVGGEVESYKIDDVQDSRKRRNPFQGEDEKQTARKHLLVLGGDPKPKPKGREERFISKKKRRPLYNHYANGCGWWDCDMEGVDNEEVGVNEVWEGVGSTTLGGIEWH
ncbi:uncharacterized protein LOC132177789 isoform X2 [Corylus avellana]|uniref:uncharacterized protein LOC132177789 isoform X2 n=1 Tax=Corylus avellana TaxID=13451 RepID=UPI001E206B3F|nr:uncharacterized protein LOC132177789 isoform X2 [Corylus avellana]